MKKNKQPIKIRLGVNIDHAATLRQVRGGTTAYPDLLALSLIAKKAGADQITVHLREDRRHIQDHDVKILCRAKPLPINLELAFSESILKLALKEKPAQACFVPEKRQELTTEGGLNLKALRKDKIKWLETFKKKGIKLSAFIEPSLEQVEISKELGFDSVEFHTGSWVKQWTQNRKSQGTERLWKKLTEASLFAHELGLHVHAGHGLDWDTTRAIKSLPHLEEVNIGHSIICYSLELGLEKTLKEYRKILTSK